MISIQVPTDGPRFTIALYFLGSLPPADQAGGLAYLQYVRRGGMVASLRGMTDIDYEAEYRRLVPQFARELAALLPLAMHPDLIVGVPSSRDLVRPYLEVCRDRFADAEDLTSSFGRSGATRAAESESFAEVLESIAYRGRRVGDAHSVLIVDDLVASGRTIAAMLVRLTEVGMPSETTISVAVPVRVISPTPKHDDRGGE